MSEFREFPKIPRLSRECVITEKLDGTNASVLIGDHSVGDVAKAVASTLVDGVQHWVFAGSRNRWITPTDDNFGFAKWVYDHADELVLLGPGHHFGEWWGVGIQRGYGLSERRFSLFNTARWSDATVRPACCHVVPVVHQGVFDTGVVEAALVHLELAGSFAAPGFMDPEGVIVYHTAANHCFKKTLGDDDGKEKRAKKERPSVPAREPAIMWTGGRRKSGAPYPEHAERRAAR